MVGGLTVSFSSLFTWEHAHAKENQSIVNNRMQHVIYGNAKKAVCLDTSSNLPCG